MLRRRRLEFDSIRVGLYEFSSLLPIRSHDPNLPRTKPAQIRGEGHHGAVPGDGPGVSIVAQFSGCNSHCGNHPDAGGIAGHNSITEKFCITRIRRAGSNSGDLPKRTGNGEEKGNPRRSTF